MEDRCARSSADLTITLSSSAVSAVYAVLRKTTAMARAPNELVLQKEQDGGKRGRDYHFLPSIVSLIGGLCNTSLLLVRTSCGDLVQ